MDFKITKQPGDIPFINQPIYLSESYLQIQNHSSFHSCYSSDAIFPFEIVEKTAISIPKSPFGSFYQINEERQHSLDFIDTSIKAIREAGCTTLTVRHPSPIYPSFVSSEKLQERGFQVKYNDINQHIKLSDSWEASLHSMQKRKLEKLEQGGFSFRKMDAKELHTAYNFIDACRQAQGLTINITWEKLAHLVERLPETYHCFGVFRGTKISAVCITVNVTSDIAYYYLPATSPLFRSNSPMVLLLEGLVKHYRSSGFKCLDLGISSVEGKPQQTLKVFKERMGAVETKKPTLTYHC